MPKSLSGRFLMAALIAFSAPIALSQPAAPGPFAKAPPLPTACYTEGETFWTKLEAAQVAVTADEEKQNVINNQIREEFQNIDPMEKASRMQQWMMDNPQEAMAYMQGVQSASADLGPGIKADADKKAQFAVEQKSVIAAHKTALQQAYAPNDAKLRALDKRVLEAQGCSFNNESCGLPAWAQAEHDTIQRERDAIYVATCSAWWGANGKVTAFMKRYKTWLLQEHVPLLESLDAQVLSQYAIMNTPAASYRSLEPYKAAREYMNAAFYLYQERETRPRCGANRC